MNDEDFEIADVDLFANNFGMWCEKHGIELGAPVSNGKQGFKAVVNLNELKVAIIEYGIHNTDKAVKDVENNLLYDLDEIDNKPWRVFRQLANIMPHYEEEYRRYENFYANGGGRKVEALIEEFEKEQAAEEAK